MVRLIFKLASQLELNFRKKKKRNYTKLVWYCTSSNKGYSLQLLGDIRYVDNEKCALNWRKNYITHFVGLIN